MSNTKEVGPVNVQEYEALAAQGQAGVENVLTILREELDNRMANSGSASVDGIGRELLYRHPRTSS